MISMHARDLASSRPSSRPLVIALALLLVVAITLVALPARPAFADQFAPQFVAVPVELADGTHVGESFRTVVTGAPAGDPLTFDSNCAHLGLAVSFRDAAAVLLFTFPDVHKEGRARPLTVYWENAAFPPGTRFSTISTFDRCVVDGIRYEIKRAHALQH